MNVPTKCRILVAVGFRARSNGIDEAPAIITRQWSDDCVNALIFRDDAAPQSVTSVKVYPDEESARAAISDNPQATVLYWPWTGGAQGPKAGA